MTPNAHTKAKMRYSPKPIAAYTSSVEGKPYGPADSKFIGQDQAGWNLAFLSFNFDARCIHPDSQFTTLVRRSVVTRLDDGKLDMLGAAPDSELVRSLLLTLTAPQFVKKIQGSALLKYLPLYKAYGETWMKTIEQRSWLCATYEDDIDDTVGSLDAAQAVLTAISAKR